MLRLLSDEDVHSDIIRGLWLRDPELDIVGARDVGLGHTLDPIILEWAAEQGRVLLTGDLSTVVGFAVSRVRSGQSMPGVFALLETVGIGRVLDDVLLAAKCYTVEEMNNQIVYIPF
jgi:Domain of unknown function (DUF5615)